MKRLCPFRYVVVNDYIKSVDSLKKRHCPFADDARRKAIESPEPIHNSGYITALVKEIEEWFYKNTGVVLGKNVVNKLRSRLHSLKAANDT